MAVVAKNKGDLMNLSVNTQLEKSTGCYAALCANTTFGWVLTKGLHL
jgi:hypothetical protein